MKQCGLRGGGQVRGEGSSGDSRLDYADARTIRRAGGRAIGQVREGRGARKGGARKGGARKGGARKGGARKGGARKGGARKGGARKGG